LAEEPTNCEVRTGTRGKEASIEGTEPVSVFSGEEKTYL